MPTQTIDFANVTSVSYDGATVTDMALNGTSFYPNEILADFLVIAGGGEGGGGMGGGGGAGGLRTSYGSVSGGGASPQTPLTLTPSAVPVAPAVLVG